MRSGPSPKIGLCAERQHSFQWDSKCLYPLKPAGDIAVPDAPDQLYEKVCKLEYAYIHRRRGSKSIMKHFRDQSFAAGRNLRLRAVSLSTRLSSFPLGFFGMISTNSTPPANLLYPTLLSATCYPRNHRVSRSELRGMKRCKPS